MVLHGKFAWDWLPKSRTLVPQAPLLFCYTGFLPGEYAYLQETQLVSLWVSRWVLPSQIVHMGNAARLRTVTRSLDSSPVQFEDF